MKIAIVMTYLNRQHQLMKTLESFLQYNPDDFFVIIVDDGSPVDIQLPEKLPFSVTVIKMKDKYWTQGDPAYNTGFSYALSKKPDIVIIQNAECYHLGDILGHAKKYVDDKSYVSYGCYSQGKGEDPGSVINNKGASFDGESAWYNHPIHRPKPYHFCAAISANNLRKLNGFDERFSFGTGFDDDYFLHQILTLGLEIYTTDEPIVVHQWHEHTTFKLDEKSLFNINYMLFQELVKQKQYRAMHVITDDL